ncbi:MAG: hypothetical protein Q8Q12_20465 [bacterium]|nr:hypothetical protein [bacterium]
MQFVQILDETRNSFRMAIAGCSQEVLLRSSSRLAAFWSSIDRPMCYLDITGLPHHIWAPLLRSGLSACRRLAAVYVEPADYQLSPVPTEGEIFDLSEKISGIAPIPGFASLTEPADERVCFVPLLGFEGIRFAYLVEQVQPPGERIIPVIGVPGFRPEYPFHAFQANMSVLKETQAWKSVRYARANCPFSLFYLLEDIAEQYPEHQLKIAPIGTKPHALGAVLFAATSRRPVELIYDHPIRKAKRTKDTGRLFVYFVSAFAQG